MEESKFQEANSAGATEKMEAYRTRIALHMKDADVVAALAAAKATFEAEMVSSHVVGDEEYSVIHHRAFDKYSEKCAAARRLASDRAYNELGMKYRE